VLAAFVAVDGVVLVGGVVVAGRCVGVVDRIAADGRAGVVERLGARDVSVVGEIAVIDVGPAEVGATAEPGRPAEHEASRQTAPVTRIITVRRTPQR